MFGVTICILYPSTKFSYGGDRRNFFETSNGRLPLNMAPTGLKLGQNEFQTIPDILLFEAQQVEILRKF